MGVSVQGTRGQIRFALGAKRSIIEQEREAHTTRQRGVMARRAFDRLVGEDKQRAKQVAQARAVSGFELTSIKPRKGFLRRLFGRKTGW